MKKNNNYFLWGLTAFTVIVCSLLANYIINNTTILKNGIGRIFDVLTPVIDGLILAYLLTPMVNVIEREIVKPLFNFVNKPNKHKFMRIISILLTAFIVGIAIYGFFKMAIPQVYESIKTIVNQFPTYVDKLEYWITKMLEDNPEIAKYLNNLINQYSIEIKNFFDNKIIPQINNIIMYVSMSVYTIIKELWNLIIGFIISLYVLSSKEHFAAQAKKIIYSVFHIEVSNRIISNIRFSNKTFGGFFVGKILDSIIIGILCFLVTSIMGTPFCVLISVIIGITNIIPFFGPFLGAIPSILLILFVNPLQALYFLIFVIILQQIDGNIIGPKILGNSTGLSSFWVIFSITLFGGLFGFIGMVVGVPIFAVIFAFIKSLVELKLNEKELPQDTSKYLKLLYIDSESKDFITFSENDKKPFANITKFLVNEKSKGKRKNTKRYNNLSEENKQSDETPEK